jgi:fatty-acyl-CoA synthase
MHSPTLCSYLSYWAERWPDRLAVKTRHGELTWGAIDRSSRAIAAHLLQTGVNHGDRVGILMHNRTEFIEAMFGILRAGAVVTLLNIRNTANELMYPIDATNVAAICNWISASLLLPASNR